MSIKLNVANPLIRDYRLNGAGEHFKIGTSVIRGYIFTRQQLFSLFEQTESKHLFIMLALTSDVSSSGNKYLTLIAAGYSTANNEIDLSKLEIGQVALTGPFSVALSDKSKYLELDPGGDVTHRDVIDGHKLFETATTSHLYASNGEKIKGYHIEDIDLDVLDLRNPNANMLDKFILVPMIRTKQLPTPPFTDPYLSIAITGHPYLQNSVKREYCLPCPNACPSNYPG